MELLFQQRKSIQPWEVGAKFVTFPECFLHPRAEFGATPALSHESSQVSWEVNTIFPINRRGNQGPEKFHSLLRVTDLVYDRTRIQLYMNPQSLFISSSIKEEWWFVNEKRKYKNNNLSLKFWATDMNNQGVVVCFPFTRSGGNWGKFSGLLTSH